MLKILSSRTVWTIIVVFLINGIGAIHSYIPVSYLPAINGILGILAIYFRVNAKVDFKE